VPASAVVPSRTGLTRRALEKIVGMRGLIGKVGAPAFGGQTRCRSICRDTPAGKS